MHLLELFERVSARTRCRGSIPRHWCAGAAFVAAVVPASMRAQTGSAPAVIHACYVPLTGTLYRIDETGLHQGCTSTSHVEFAWTDGVGAVHATDALSGDLAGTFAAPSVVRLQGKPVSGTAPAAGQVLTFDGTSWNPAVPAVASSIDGSFLATGTMYQGSIPATGYGSRMMWYAGKAAFRAGGVESGSGDQWDDANIGVNSIAMGESTIASGSEATALGAATTASGTASTALGFGAVATALASTAIGRSTVASGMGSIAMGSFASTNAKNGSFVYGDNSSSTVVSAVAGDQFVVRAQHFWLGTDNNVTATGGRLLETSTGAYLSTGGVWTNVSDVNRKEAFRPISGDDVLSRLADMPVQEWSYKAEGPTIRHIGPTAQDFYAAFHLGSSNTSIGTIDADGVSLAAIKALADRTRDLSSSNEKLNARMADLAAENARLRAQNAQVTARLDALEAALANLSAGARQPEPR